MFFSCSEFEKAGMPWNGTNMEHRSEETARTGVMAIFWGLDVLFLPLHIFQAFYILSVCAGLWWKDTRCLGKVEGSTVHAWDWSRLRDRLQYTFCDCFY